jgi:hypothetical protein
MELTHEVDHEVLLKSRDKLANRTILHQKVFFSAGKTTASRSEYHNAAPSLEGNTEKNRGSIKPSIENKAVTRLGRSSSN